MHQQWLFTEAEQGVFNYTEGEIVSKKAKEAGQILRCHALVWHSQLGLWVRNVTWTADTMRAAIVDHIEKVAGHWKDECYAWDVVNEAFEEDGTYRKSIFYETLGPEYIDLAFKTAARVTPKAKLYYNDYNLESPSKKTEAVQKLVKDLRAKGIKIDGVGLQAHLIAEDHPTLDQHIAAIKGFADLSVDVALTELDVRLTLPATEANLAQQKLAYANVSATLPTSTVTMMWDADIEFRLSVLVPKSRAASVSPFGTFMTPSAGSPMCLRVRARLVFGSRTSPPTPPTMASLMLSRTTPRPPRSPRPRARARRPAAAGPLSFKRRRFKRGSAGSVW